MLGMSSDSQWYNASPYFNTYVASARLLHTRHMNKANTLFGDGHVNASGRGELINNGIKGFKTQAGCNQDGVFF